MNRLKRSPDSRCFFSTRLQMCCTAMAQSGVRGEGFQRDVAADGGEEGVPGPHRHREVEGA